jgi:hypothetical protein
MGKYSELKEKYKGFTVPAYKIVCGGSELPRSEFLIDKLMIDNEMGKVSGACGFTVNNVYEHGAGKFSAAALDKLVPGNRISVSLGYGSTVSEVFTGYIDELGISCGGDEISLRVNCLDARALMREGYGYAIAQGKNIQAVASGILDKYSSLINSKKITLEARETGVNLTQAGNDLDYIQNAAELRGKYFYIECGEAYIGDAKGTVCVEFDWPQCEMEFGVRHIERKIVGIGYDYANMGLFTAEKEITGKNALMTVTRAVHLPPHLLGDAGTDAVADMADKMKREAVSGTIFCRGIPEPRLGQKIKINKFPLANLCGSAFTVISIRHRINSEDGFTTEIGIEG